MYGVRLSNVVTINAGTDHIGSATIDNFNVNGTIAADAFNRLRTSFPSSVFSSVLTDDADTLAWSSATVGSGNVAYVANVASVDLSLTTASSVAQRQTYSRSPYNPGESMIILMTGTWNIGQSGITKRMGLFDSSNGLFLEQEGTTMYWVIRSSTSGTPVNTRIVQNLWNLDPLDGSGSSGITFDPAMINLMIIDLSWLGTGRVRFGFMYNGIQVYAHQFVNNASIVYMSTPNLPLGYYIESSASYTGSSASLRQTCSAILIEGVPNQVKASYTVGSITTLPATSISCPTSAETPLIAVRTRAGFQANTLVCNHIHALNTVTNSNAIIRVYVRAILSGVTAWTAVTNSEIEYTIYKVGTNAFTFTLTNASLIDEFFVSRDTHSATSVEPTNIRQSLSGGIGATTGQILLLTGIGISATSDMYVSVSVDIY